MKKTIRAAILLAFAFNLTNSSNVYAQEQSSFSEIYEKFNKSVIEENNIDSIKFGQQALSLGEVKFGADSANAANLKYNLALAYSRHKQPKKAFALLEDVRDKYEQIYGENSIEHYNVILEILYLPPMFRESQKRTGFGSVSKSYKKYIVKAISILEALTEQYPNLSPANNYYLLAKTMNKQPLANHFFNYAFRINEDAEEYLLTDVGQQDGRTVEIQFMLAKYLKAKNKTNSAIEYFEKVVNTVNDEIDTSHPFELASHAALVDLYERKGKSDDATKHCVAIGKMTPWNDDIEPIPLYRLNPKYPKGAARIGREGSVKVSFDIDDAGFVKNIAVLESSSHAFEETTMNAVKKWRYAPKVVNGNITTAKDLTVLLEYKLKL